ncbi:EamA family transporter [Nibricoccus aquaticus]|uniref:EamA family transporter n=1 Tax=Nibricoccus aquaticus TaxID=2576891 RepID=A0A290QKB5_9BACT|nr:EamA family transporter [Nibricoccus aquaticus]ATC64312.1 EamA family transporter [Nibricoccus aquaticus]
MSALALVIVLIAAFMHATWNLAAKRAGGGIPFVWLCGTMALVLYLPVTVAYCATHPVALSSTALGVILGGGIAKIAYSLLLQRGYRTGDFSLIYPLARGTGPLLSTIAAIAIFHERPTPLALVGGAVIVASVFYLTGGPQLLHQSRAHLRQAIFYGVACGLVIAIYTVWDQRAVAHLHIPPILYDAGTQIVVTASLTPFALRRRSEIAFEWRTHRWHALTIAVLGSTGYVLILTAMKFTPVSYIAPAREISIVIGAFFGAKILKEGDTRRRLFAASGMALGIIALALG